MAKFTAGSRNLLDIRKREPKRSEALAPARGPKPLRLKTRRRRQRILTFCICLLCGAGVVGGLAAATHIEKFAINGVSVTGADKIPTDALAAAVTTSLSGANSHLFSQKNIFLYRKNAIETTLATDFPRIKDISLTRASLLAQALVVTVREREPYATWCPSEIGGPSHGAGDQNSACYVMDQDGFIYAPLEGEASLMGFAASDDTPKTAYVFRGGLIPHTDVVGQTFLRGRIRDITKFLDDLAAAGFTATGLSVDSEKDFTVTLQSGPMLMASFDMAPQDIIRNLETALEADDVKAKLSSLQYIDLRFGNRVYYK